MSKGRKALKISERARRPETWHALMASLQSYLARYDPPAVTREATARKDPFRVLIATMISLRTKDEVTAKAAERLFALGDTPKKLANLEEEVIAQAIRPANFYKTKARRIREVARRIVAEFSGEVPKAMDSLLSLPGVGRKTANLVLAEGYDLEGLCVDTHVHRVTNRLGLLKTKNPTETEMALREVLPRPYWKPINTYLVSFGQRVCHPVSPRCSSCPISAMCEKVGVKRYR